MSDLTNEVEAFTRQDSKRPVILAGWSTGGLIATRMVQSESLQLENRRVVGMILFTPGVSVYPIVGDGGIITEETLTSNPNPPHRGPIKPSSPFVSFCIIYNDSC